MEILEVDIDTPWMNKETEELWEQAREYPWNRRKLFACMAIPETFIRKHWSELSEEEHHNCIVHQKLSTQFLLDYWNLLTKDERKACFEHQKLKTEFLEHEWLRMAPTNWLVIARAQVLAPEFIMSRWPFMDWWWKVKAIEWQKKFPARLPLENWEEVNHSLYAKHYRQRRDYYCEDLTMAELPEYLSCGLDAVRTSAEKWLSELQRRAQHGYERTTRAN